MIFQEGGRWRSEPSIDESRKELGELLDKLTPEERISVQHVLDEINTHGSSVIADECTELEWEETPLSIEDWLDSYHHVGDLKDSIYPVLKEDMIELFNGNYHEVILCLHPDTRIPLLDGSTPTIKTLAEQWNESRVPIWIYSHIDGKLVPAQAFEPRQTGIDDYFRVTLDDGSSFTGNARHQMLLVGGKKCMIRDMRPGDSLMPFNVRSSSEDKRDDLSNYEQIQQLDGKWCYTHRIVGSRQCVKESTGHSVIHHENFDKRNNLPSNLRWMTWKGHTELHRRLAHRERRLDITFEAIKNSGANSIKDASRRLGCSCSRIRAVIMKQGLEPSILYGERRGCKSGKPALGLATIREAISSGDTTYADVSNRIGYSKSSIINCLKKNKLTWYEVNSVERDHRQITFDDITTALRLGSSTVKATAERISCSVSTIHNVLRRHDKTWKDIAKPVPAGNHFVVSVDYVGNGPVYCMTVPAAGNFAISTNYKEDADPSYRSGVLSSNTGATRWG